MALLLVNPRVALSTVAVFSKWDGTDRGPLASGPPLEAALGGRNDLESAARALVPDVGEVLAVLANVPGTLLIRMSGSGATCFALFESDRLRDEAATSIRGVRPDWWQLATRLR
jgi:4-diphosphocytidyl-2-C-methyl-D-erythritol kinase